MRSLISINDFNKEEMLQVLDLAAEYEANPNRPIFKDKLIALTFFEPSTRTRLSFGNSLLQDWVLALWALLP